ncbi:hypothetical protein IWW57_002592 [Coemansia sp. S610]|nr:hypothetical protein IWW57_002592 [Coemansia sp. S610]
MLSMESFNTEPEESIPHDAIPFPVLRHLQFCFRDSIDDDTLFRGNAATLGTLETAFPPSVVPMLIRHNVFTPVSHPMLRFVGAWNLSVLVPNTFASMAACLKFVLSIGPKSSVRKFYESWTGETLVSSLSSLDGLSYTQVLSLYAIDLNLWDVLALAKLLLFLTDLHSLDPL